MALATASPTSTTPPVRTALAPQSGRLVWVIAATAVLVRLPFVAAPAGADEAGFLQVAHQWSPGGSSLYGDYWVDRPPLLLTLFQLADAGGGLVALRLLGCLAVAVTIVLCARTAGLLSGRRARPWAALAAAAMLVSPLMGSLEVNGELLAAPFVAAGIAAIVESGRTREQRRGLVLAASAGAAGVGALLVKQNIVDVLVFAAIFLLAGARQRTVVGAAEKAAAALAGGFAMLVVIAAWTVAHGTSLTGVFDAMYPFRLQAAEVVTSGGSQYASERGITLLAAFLTSGAALLVAAALVSTARRRVWEPALLALIATVAFDAFSIAMGGGYWLHYLVESVVPLAVWAGVLVGRGAVAPRIAALVVMVLAAQGLMSSGLHPTRSSAQQVGAAIARVARPGDTLTTLYGESQVNFAAGLPSPYEHLWSLPIKTLDPRLTGLDAVLSGPAAPTWVVVSHDVASWGLNARDTQRLIDTDYRPVAQIDGQTVYLHDGSDRVAPSLGRQVVVSPSLFQSR